MSLVFTVLSQPPTVCFTKRYDIISFSKQAADMTICNIIYWQKGKSKQRIQRYWLGIIPSWLSWCSYLPISPLSFSYLTPAESSTRTSVSIALCSSSGKFSGMQLQVGTCHRGEWHKGSLSGCRLVLNPSGNTQRVWPQGSGEHTGKQSCSPQSTKPLARHGNSALASEMIHPAKSTEFSSAGEVDMFQHKGPYDVNREDFNIQWALKWRAFGSAQQLGPTCQ